MPREFRAAWVATVANIDWPSKPGLSTDQQRAQVIAILDRCVELNLNAVVFQVRPCADALYRSDLEPWSEYITGKMGEAPSPAYDPLEFIVEEAHNRGLHLHVWFNPYRAGHPSRKSDFPKDHISRTRPDLVREYGANLWLDPGEPDAVEHSIAVFMDVVNRYDIDGVHIDDYFYPYPINDDDGNPVPFPDAESYARAVAGGETLDRDDWRRQNVDRLIERMYREVKAVKPWVLVGISPFGIWRPGHPPTVKGFDAYANLYADARKWLHEGWLDYASPQLYWKSDRPNLEFPVLLEWWAGENKLGRHLWPGNAVYREGPDGWPSGEVAKQVGTTRDQEGATGNVFFSMKVLMKGGGVAGTLVDGPYEKPALIPETTWIEGEPPAKPLIELNSSTASWKLPEGVAPWKWVVQLRRDGQWIPGVMPGSGSKASMTVEGFDAIAVSAVDRLGRESDTEVLQTTKGASE
ncbi:MAG: family 10 glycosylhydrolase [Planctomycetota bacterium]